MKVVVQLFHIALFQHFRKKEIFESSTRKKHLRHKLLVFLSPDCKHNTETLAKRKTSDHAHTHTHTHMHSISWTNYEDWSSTLWEVAQTMDWLAFKIAFYNPLACFSPFNTSLVIQNRSSSLGTWDGEQTTASVHFIFLLKKKKSCVSVCVLTRAVPLPAAFKHWW